MESIRSSFRYRDTQSRKTMAYQQVICITMFFFYYYCMFANLRAQYGPRLVFIVWLYV